MQDILSHQFGHRAQQSTCYRKVSSTFMLLCYKCCLRASVDTEMCCPKGKCGCQYFIVSFAKVTRYRSFCFDIFWREYTVEPVRSDTRVFRHPVTSDKNFRSQNISLTFFVKKPWVFRHLSLPTSDIVLRSQCY